MFYITEDIVKNAFLNIREKIENKFFGLLGILKCIDAPIIDSNNTYRFLDGELARFLDNVFYLSHFTGRYGDSEMYVKFSSMWVQYVSDKFFKRSVNVYDVIAFVYKSKGFNRQLTNNELKKLFCQEFHLTNEILNLWFDLSNKDIQYDDRIYRIDGIKKALHISGDTLSMDKPFSVAARAGELSRAPFLQTLYAGMDSIKCMLILKENIDNYYPKSNKMNSINHNLLNDPLQQIYYGAPGTGKSCEIDKLTKKYDTIRTTFHPDSDYSTFVGAYKPIMEEVDVQIVPVAVAGGITLDTNKGTYKEKRISYKFVKQAFLKAYLAAWKKYAEGDEDSVQPQFLVIEEINRGNCAQIFGDLFQLLDRQDNGFSTYPIEADADLQREIAEAFAEEGGEYQLPEGRMNLDGVVEDYKGDLESDIRSGCRLLLPSNLYIWATMNTSDQSLFPIDSAFKRRWDWHYVKIADAKQGYKIECGDEACDWWEFISKMNDKIAEETSSDDKKLGYFFCKPDKEGGYISLKRFVSKVIFYLWNDVYKDGNTEDFNVSDDPVTAATFEAFYNDDNTENVANVRKFLVNIVGEDALTKKSDSDEEDEAPDDNPSNIGKAKFSYNGTPMTLNKIAQDVVLQYGNSHPELTTAEIVKAKFNELCGDFGTTVIKTESEYHELDGQLSQKQNWQDIVLANGIKLYVYTQWRAKKPNDNFMQFISVVISING